MPPPIAVSWPRDPPDDVRHRASAVAPRQLERRTCRAVHTTWQGFVASAGPVYMVSGDCGARGRPHPGPWRLLVTDAVAPPRPNWTASTSSPRRPLVTGVVESCLTKNGTSTCPLGPCSSSGLAAAETSRTVSPRGPRARAAWSDTVVHDGRCTPRARLVARPRRPRTALRAPVEAGRGGTLGDRGYGTTRCRAAAGAGALSSRATRLGAVTAALVVATRVGLGRCCGGLPTATTAGIASTGRPHHQARSDSPSGDTAIQHAKIRGCAGGPAGRGRPRAGGRLRLAATPLVRGMRGGLPSVPTADRAAPSGRRAAGPVLRVAAPARPPGDSSCSTTRRSRRAGRRRRTGGRWDRAGWPGRPARPAPGVRRRRRPTAGARRSSRAGRPPRSRCHRCRAAPRPAARRAARRPRRRRCGRPRSRSRPARGTGTPPSP